MEIIYLSEEYFGVGEDAEIEFVKAKQRLTEDINNHLKGKWEMKGSPKLFKIGGGYASLSQVMVKK